MSKEEQRQGSEGASEDVVLVHGPTEDGKGLEVLRKRGETVTTGEMRPLVEGKAITGEVVSLRSRSESPLLFDVELVHAAESRRGGPAQVSTESYRAGWKAVFGNEKPRKPKRPYASRRTLN